MLRVRFDSDSHNKLLNIEVLTVKSVKEMRRGREYHVCGEECNVEKRESESNTIFPIIFKLFRRISSGEEGEWMEILWEANKGNFVGSK